MAQRSRRDAKEEGFFGGGCPRQWVGFGRDNGTTKPTKFHEKVKIGSLGGGFVGSDCFVGFRDFRGFLDGGDNRYGAKVAKGRKGRGILWEFRRD